MRRVARHLFPFCATISLVGFVAVVGLRVYVESVGSRRVIYREVTNGERRISTNLFMNREMLCFRRDEEAFPMDSSPAAWSEVPTTNRPTYQFFRNHGFMLDRARYQTSHGEIRWFAVALPNWLVIFAFLILPLAWLRRSYRKYQASRVGLCESCGYDLRASPDRCPECGTATAPAAGPAGSSTSG